MRRQRSCAEKFDVEVNNYNNWLKSLQNTKKTKGSIIRHCVRFILHIFYTPVNSVSYTHPLYSRDDLTPVQKDAIAIGSDWKRISDNLENILSGDLTNSGLSIDEVNHGKQITQTGYEHCQRVYLANGITTTNQIKPS